MCRGNLARCSSPPGCGGTSTSTPAPPRPGIWPSAGGARSGKWRAIWTSRGSTRAGRTAATRSSTRTRTPASTACSPSAPRRGASRCGWTPSRSGSEPAAVHEDEQEHIHLGGEGDPAVYTGEQVRLRSAGIDIGSSTSHLVFSDLVLARQGRYLSSRYQVVQRDVRFRSRVILTPYASRSQIDTAGVGRLLAWDGGGALRRVEERGRAIAREAGVAAAPGDVISSAALDAVAGHLAGLIVRVIDGQPLPERTGGLWITEPLRSPGPFSHIVFSGGVAEYIYGCETAEFGDLGPRLAAAVLARGGDRVILNPRERIRATCIGASQYTVQVSGNTIFLPDAGILPVRNVPVAAVRGLDSPSRRHVAEAVRRALRRLDLADGDGRFALAIHWHHGPEYAALSELCRGIVEALPETVGARRPLLLVIDADVAGLVGRTLREECGVAGPLACIDQVALREFDYVDIGSPISDQYVVPVVVKSLVFH